MLVDATEITSDVVAHFRRKEEAASLVSVRGELVCIKHMRDGECIDTYEIPLEDCRTTPGVLCWIAQLKTKNWVDDYLLMSFCRSVFRAVTKANDAPF